MPDMRQVSPCTVGCRSKAERAGEFADRRIPFANFGGASRESGGNNGISRATAKRFLKEGAYVFITERRQTEPDIAVAISRSWIDRVYEVARKTMGRVDVVCADGGVVDSVSLTDSNAETFDRDSALNTRGACSTVQRRCRFVRTWTIESAGRGIRANVISPGPSDTRSACLRSSRIIKEHRPWARPVRVPKSSSQTCLIAA
jgi:NAD(P)-dependent dehydrogenase (short-subunit alcohol dehydrogenase family)